MNTAIKSAEVLLRRPDAVLVLERLRALLDEEARRRAAFREWLDGRVKAEFINGEVIMHSPVKRKHIAALRRLSGLLMAFNHLHPQGELMLEKALIGLTRNDYEPDLCFFTAERAEAFTDDQMVFPAPDFVVEILSPSTAKTDRGIKRIDYALHGVREYWIVDPDHERVEQYLRPGNDTAFLPPRVFYGEADLRSHVIEGFQIPTAAIFDDEVCAQTLRTIAANAP